MISYITELLSVKILFISTLAVQSSFQATYVYIGSMELVHSEFLNQKVNQSNNGSNKIIQFNKSIKFKNVTFSYEDSIQNVLKDVSLEIPSKSSVALVGRSGSGKTTLVDLITLINEGYGGEISIDGVQADSIDKSSWRRQIGYVSQDTNFMIILIIFQWVRGYYSSKDCLSKIKEAAAHANILSFIESLPDGFNTLVGDRGILLSGGQKQRIFIARELFRKPKLLILDEATSALDNISEKAIQKSIDLLKGKITVILSLIGCLLSKVIKYIY